MEAPASEWIGENRGKPAGALDISAGVVNKGRRAHPVEPNLMTGKTSLLRLP